jgi:hypothetical protein
MRRSTHDKPRIISCAELTSHHVALPRGCFDAALDLLVSLGITVTIEDRRFSGAAIPLSFTGALRPDQETAINALLRALEPGRSPVVITERTAHLEAIAKRLQRFARHVIVLRGGQSEKQRRDIAARLAAIPQAEERVIVATGRYLGEGFDDSRLDTLFLTMPIAWKGTLAQYAGRLHRLNDAKREVIIYDYADMGVPVLARMAAKRRIGYQAIGYKVLGTRDLFSDRAVTSNEPT